MKEILKHFKPEFTVNDTGQVVDSNGVFLCTVQSCWENKVNFAQEIAAALNKAVTWNVESTPTGDNCFEDAWKAAEVEGGQR